MKGEAGAWSESALQTLSPAVQQAVRGRLEPSPKRGTL